MSSCMPSPAAIRLKRSSSELLECFSKSLILLQARSAGVVRPWLYKYIVCDCWLLFGLDLIECVDVVRPRVFFDLQACNDKAWNKSIVCPPVFRSVTLSLVLFRQMWVPATISYYLMIKNWVKVNINKHLVCLTNIVLLLFSEMFKYFHNQNALFISFLFTWIDIVMRIKNLLIVLFHLWYLNVWMIWF